jgi:hypothetical protein
MPVESQGDVIRRKAESRLYSEKLIPESRGDVLGLIEATDDIIDEIKKTAVMFQWKCPKYRRCFTPNISIWHRSSSRLSITSWLLADLLPGSLECQRHAGFSLPPGRNQPTAGGKIKRLAFLNEEMPLSKKMHLRYFAYHIDLICR